MMVKFHETLSDESVYLRFFHMEQLSSRVAHERLIRKCFIDYDQEMALVAERTDPNTGQREIVAVGRLTRARSANKAEVAVLVSDLYQRHGLGTELVRRLIQVASDQKVRKSSPTSFRKILVCARSQTISASKSTKATTLAWSLRS